MNQHPSGTIPNHRLDSAMRVLLALLACALLPTSAAQAAPPVAEIVRKTNHASYYQGTDGRAHVKMTITDKQGRKRVRSMTILRRDAEGSADGEQKFYVYFHEPADVAKTVFLVHKKLGADDDRWLYLPSLDLVKRIAAADKRTSFVGSDFVYEDVSGRSLDEDTHKLVETTKNYYVLEHTPRAPTKVRFARYRMYVHRGSFLPTKVEYYDKAGKKYRVMTVEAVETIQGKATVTRASIQDLSAGSKTVVEYSKVTYDVGLPERIFTERYLRRMPVKYMQ